MAAAAGKPYAPPPTVYTGIGLALYDALVLGINTPYIWRCPNKRIVEMYNANASSNHLDIGVGTGYFLDRCKFPAGKVRLALLDMSPDSLAKTAGRLSRYNPETYTGDVLKPISVRAPFDSVGMNYLVHCLPGTMRTKRAAFQNVREIMKPGAVLFGSTVLQKDIHHHWLAKRMLASLNQKGIFSTLEDDAAGLKANLAACFSESKVEIVGGVGVFWARR